MTGNERVDRTIDVICHQGCRAVWGFIDALEAGTLRPEYAHLDAAERALLLAELHDIMQVYGDRCDL